MLVPSLTIGKFMKNFIRFNTFLVYISLLLAFCSVLAIGVSVIPAIAITLVLFALDTATCNHGSMSILYGLSGLIVARILGLFNWNRNHNPLSSTFQTEQTLIGKTDTGINHSDTDIINDSKNCEKNSNLENPALLKSNSTPSQVPYFYQTPKNNPEDRTGIEQNNLDSSQYRNQH